MIRLAPWDIVASSPRPPRRRRRGMGRFAAPERRLGFWLALWALVIAAEFGALVPVIFPGEERVEAVQVVYRLIGGSFAACGLIAWRRRPDSRSGLLMAVAGAGFFVSALISQFHPPVAQTAAMVLDGALGAVLRGAAADAADRRTARVDASTGSWCARFVLPCGSCRSSGCCSTSRTATCWPSSRTPTSPTRSTSRSARWPASSASPRGRRRAAVAGGVAAAAARAAAERRGQRGPAALRRAADQRPRDRLALAGRAVGRGPLAGERAGGLPRRAAALAAGPRRPRGPLPRPQHDARRATCRRRWPRRSATPASWWPIGCRSRWATPTPTAARCWCPRSPPTAPPRGSRARAARSRRSSTTPRSTTTPSWSTRSAPRRHRAGERAPARRGRGPARRGAGLARAHRRGGRRRAPAAGAQPARRRAAAPGRPRRCSCGCCRAASARDPARASSSPRPRATSSPSRSQELRELARGIHPAVLNHGLAAALDSLAARSTGADHGLLDAPRAPARAGRARGLLRGLRGAGQRRQVRPGDGGHRARLAHGGRASSRSPTTASAAPTRPAARGCADWPTASRRWTGGCASSARRAPGPSSRRSCRAGSDRGRQHPRPRRHRRAADARRGRGGGAGGLAGGAAARDRRPRTRRGHRRRPDAAHADRRGPARGARDPRAPPADRHRDPLPARRGRDRDAPAGRDARAPRLPAQGPRRQRRGLRRRAAPRRRRRVGAGPRGGDGLLGARARRRAAADPDGPRARGARADRRGPAPTRPSPRR